MIAWNAQPKPAGAGGARRPNYGFFRIFSELSTELCSTSSAFTPIGSVCRRVCDAPNHAPIWISGHVRTNVLVGRLRFDFGERRHFVHHDSHDRRRVDRDSLKLPLSGAPARDNRLDLIRAPPARLARTKHGTKQGVFLLKLGLRSSTVLPEAIIPGRNVTHL
jgi:hypothetical protein